MALAQRKPVTAPLQAVDILSGAQGGYTTPFSDTGTQSNTVSPGIDPSQYEYLNVTGLTGASEAGLGKLNAEKQPWYSQLGRAGIQFTANMVASVGQGLADTFDMHSAYQNMMGSGSYDSHLFGLSSRDMATWAEGVSRRNQIYEKDPGGVHPFDSGWWMNQLASSGTSLGMAIEAGATSFGIEALTEGMGTEMVMGKFANLMSRLKGVVKGSEDIAELAKAAEGFKSMSAAYIGLNRYAESKMEARQTFDQTKEELAGLVNPDGTRKYTDQQVDQFSRAGAEKDFHYNMAMLPLDILSYSAMTFNPISGEAEGMMERGLEKLAGLYGESKLGKAAGWLTTKSLALQSEGIEEGFQDFAQKEGQHYAEVLGGMDDGKSFSQRLGAEVSGSDFWNNYLGGVIGEPLVGGIMEAVNRTERGLKQKAINSVYQKFTSNVGKLDNDTAVKIKQLQAAGNDIQAANMRMNFNVNKTLKALMMDSVSNRDEAYNAHMANRQGLLAELENGKTDGLIDLGHPDSTEASRDIIKSELKQQIADSATIKNIYDDVKSKYNRNFVMKVTSQKFYLQRMLEEMPDIDKSIRDAYSNDANYNSLSAHGKQLADTQYQLAALKNYKNNLSENIKYTTDVDEKQHREDMLDNINKRIDDLVNTHEQIQEDENYNDKDKESDNAALTEMHINPNKDLFWGLSNKVEGDGEIQLGRKDLALWGKDEYVERARNKVFDNALVESEITDAMQEIKSSKISMFEKIGQKGKVAVRAVTSKITSGQRARAEARAEQIKVEQAETAKKNQIVTDTADELKDKENNPVEESEYTANLVQLADMLGSVDMAHVDTASAPPPLSDVLNAPGAVMTFSLSPSVKDADGKEATQEQKNSIRDQVAGLINRMGNPTGNFEDLARDVLKKDGEATTKHVWNLLAYGWEANGKAPADYNAIYNSIFSNHVAELVRIQKELTEQGSKAQELVDQNQWEESGIVNSFNPPGEGGTTGQSHTYNTGVTSRSDPKGQFSTFMVHTKVTETQDGKEVLVDRHFTGAEGMNNKWINSAVLLGDKSRPGMKTIIKVPKDYNSVPVAVFGTDGNYVTFIPFGQYISERFPVDRNTWTAEQEQEYRDKLPMIHYPVGFDNGGKGIMQVHDTGWYHKVRFDEGSPEEMQKAIENVRAIREEVIASWDNDKGKNEVPATVTNVIQTTFDPLKIVVGGGVQGMTLMEANPETTLGLVMDSLDSKDIIIKPGEKFHSSDRILLNSKPQDAIGRIVDIRKFGMKDGVPTYVAFKVTRPKLGKEAKTTVQQLLQYWATRKSGNKDVRDKNNKIKQAVEGLSGFDLSVLNTGFDFNSYLSHFVYVDTLSKKVKGAVRETQDVAKAIHKIATDTLPVGTPYMQSEKYRIIIGQAGIGETGTELWSKENDAAQEAEMMKNLDKLKNTPVTIPEKRRSPDGTEGVVQTKYNSIFDWYEQNLNMKNIAKNRAIVHINEEGKASQAPGGATYTDYLKNNLRTNVKSLNIGTAEKPEWVTNAQPTVTYETDSRLKKMADRSKSDAQVKKDIVDSEEKKPTRGTKLDDALATARTKALNEQLSDLEARYYDLPEGLSENEKADINDRIENGDKEAIKKYTKRILNSEDLKKAQEAYDKGNFVMDEDGETSPKDLEAAALRNASMVTVGNTDMEYDSPEDLFKEYRNGDVEPDFMEAAEERLKEYGLLHLVNYNPNQLELFGEEEGQAKPTTETEVKKEEEEESPEDFLKRMNDFTKNDGGINGALLSPTVMTDAQAKVVENSLTKIAGLSPQEQFETLDFLSNEIIPTIEANGGDISKAEVDKIVQDRFNELLGERAKVAEAEIKKAIAYAEKYPDKAQAFNQMIARLQNTITKISDVGASMDKLMELAYREAKKSSNIKMTKERLQDSIEDDEDRDESGTDDGESEEKRERAFGSEILSENPENKVTKKMRRFFARVIDTEADGTKKQGVFNLPVYVNKDVIVSFLQKMLADTPPSFDAKMGKLATLVETVPWIQEIIDRLKNTSEANKKVFTVCMDNSTTHMSFALVGFNKKTKRWYSKVKSTISAGAVESLRDGWRQNFMSDSSLVQNDAEGDPRIVTDKANQLIQKYRDWKGYDLPTMNASYEDFWKKGIETLKKPNESLNIVPKGAMLDELKSKLKEGEKGKVSIKAGSYIIKDMGKGMYNIRRESEMIGDTKGETMTRMDEFLRAFGITVKPQTLATLYDNGLYHNTRRISPGGLFYSGGADKAGKTNGLFGVLYNNLISLAKNPDTILDEDSQSPLDDTVIESLANLDARYRSDVGPKAFRDGGENYYTVTARKYITDRAIDLVGEDSEMRDTLAKMSFSQHSFLLSLLSDDADTKAKIDKIRAKLQTEQTAENRKQLEADLENAIKNTFRGKFKIAHLGKTAIKQQGKKRMGDNSISAISEVSHEMAKMGFFSDMTQGSVKNNMGLNNYPDSTIPIRVGTMFSPTMSDKTMMTLLTTALLDLGREHLMGDNGQMSQQLVNIIYSQVVKPEIARMLGRASAKASNVENYDEGAFKFYFLTNLNDLTYGEAKLTNLLRTSDTFTTLESVENDSTIMNAIHQSIRDYVEKLSNDKVAKWDKMDNLTKYFDADYVNNEKFEGTDVEKKKQMAMDYVINSMISTANSFMLFGGDPAMYYKDNINKSLINIGKRLANQIAPGAAIAESVGDRYIQLFLKDRKSVAGNIAYINKLYGEGSYEAKQYSSIEASDAQEYTTWKEHLDVLSRLGKTNDYLLDVSQEDIDEAGKLFADPDKYPEESWTEKQREIVNKVTQPMKPVYTYQIPDMEGDFMRTVYIKSSSFPLVPQLTKGMHIDKLRIKMEQLQAPAEKGGLGKNVRASYGTANKVGAITNPSTIWKKDGSIDEDALDKIGESSLEMRREGFRIQQDIPFKTEKNREDRVTLGTQMMKLLFGDEIINATGFNYKGEPMDGRALHQQYTDTISKFVDLKQKQLFDELGLDKIGEPIDKVKTFGKLQKMLQEEADKRDYPLQDIEGLKLIQNPDGTHSFNLPLWISTSSNRYESMLNSIVTNRMVKIKMPGAGYVVGSPEGFIREKVAEEDIDKVLTPEQRSQIIFTSAWNNKELQGQTEEMKDGKTKIKKAQIFVASKLRTPGGDLVDLFQKKDGKYVYLKETNRGFELNEDMFDKDVLSMFTFRIPSSGLQSGTSVEIAGFLPHSVGDLMIVPSNFTKQKGLDFDVDKEQGYSYWTHTDKDGKILRLREEHRNRILKEVDDELKKGKTGELIAKYKEAKGIEKNRAKKVLDQYIASSKFINSLFPDGIKYTEEDFENNKFLANINDQITEKLLQNDIIEVMHSVYSNDNPNLQRKMNKVLNTKEAEGEADYIQGLQGQTQAKGVSYDTILSDEYQKGKLMSGSSGKTGTGAYSLDLVFHSLLQQAYDKSSKDNVRLQKYGKNKTATAFAMRFGRVSSDGTFGRHRTLGVDGRDGDRSITEGLSERQNMAVDNEKLQIMGLLGVDKETMIVDKVLSLLGFDKGEDGHNISFLFLSQPVIKRFNELLRNANSVVAKFDPNVEQKILTKIMGEFNFRMSDMGIDKSAQMSTENMGKAISDGGVDGGLQAAVLKRFIELRAYGYAMMKAQSTLNFKNNSLGRSYFEVLDKNENLGNLLNIEAKDPGTKSSLGTISNLDRLVGEYNTSGGEGFIKVGGDSYIKPTTYIGKMNVMSTVTAVNLWSDYFPYNSFSMRRLFDEIIPQVGNGDNMSATKKVELKQEIFRHLKKYLNTGDTGIVGSSDNVNAERFRLMMDSNGNTSLSSYVKALMQSEDPIVKHYIKSNKLFERLTFTKGDTTKPSTIMYNNAAGEEYDEEYLYQTFSSMLAARDKDGNRIKLPPIGNKEYTVDTLAQDMVAYSMLAASTQQATEFVKYVPMAYLEAIGYTQKMRDLNDSFDNMDTGQILVGEQGPNGEKNAVSAFTMQYLQHNPNRVKYKVDIDDVGTELEGIKLNKDSQEIESFTALSSQDTPDFVSIYNPNIRGEKKFMLFYNDGNKYVRISVLGTYNMDEYDARNNGIGNTIMSLQTNNVAQFYPARRTQTQTFQETGDRFGVSSNDVSTVVGNIVNSELGNMSALAAELSPHISSINGIQYADTYTDHTGKVITNFDGVYDYIDNKIYISSKTSPKMTVDVLASKVMHEVVHGVTMNQFQKYIERKEANGEVKLTADAPIYVQNIARIYNQLRAEEGDAKLAAVRAKVGKQDLTGDEYNTYGLTDINEFMTMALTHKDFQKFLASKKMPDGKNMLDRFVELIKQTLQAIGVNFETNTAAAQAMDSILTFIKEENQATEQGPAGDDLTAAFNQQAWEEGGFGDPDENGVIGYDDEGNPLYKDFSLSPSIEGLSVGNPFTGKYTKGTINDKEKVVNEALTNGEIERVSDDEYKYKGVSYTSLEDVGKVLLKDKLHNLEFNGVPVDSKPEGNSREEIAKYNEDIPKVQEGEFPGKKLEIREENCR